MRERNRKTANDILRQYKSGYKDFRNIIVDAQDLSKQLLAQANFEGATLMGCNFQKSILKHASFSAANLREADLRGADLSKANLKGADLRGAAMRNVNLSGADLRWANLEGVNLSGSNLSGANFDGANLKNANLKDTDTGKLWWKTNLDEAKLDGTVLPDGTVFGQIIADSNE
jgi:uncharacterized protein YjbI with pentapeptide repeats